MKKLNNAEVKAIRQMKASKTNKASVGSLRFVLRNSPYREKEYKLFSFDIDDPGKERTSFISWEDYERI